MRKCFDKMTGGGGTDTIYYIAAYLPSNALLRKTT